MTNFANGTSGNSDLVFSAYDNVAGVGYTFDLGLAINTLLGSTDNATTGAAAAPDSVIDGTGVLYDGALEGFDSFLAGATLSNVEWNLAAAESDGRNRVVVSQGDTAANVAMNNSKVSTSANNFNSYMDALAAKTGSVSASAQTTDSDAAAYAGGATWGSTAGVTGGVDNTNFLTDGSTANLFILAQTNTLGSQGGAAAYSAQIEDAAGNPLTATVYKEGDVWKLKVQAVNTDQTAPTVATFSPADEAVGVSVSSNIVVTFSEDILKGAGNIVIKNAAGEVVESFDVATSANITVSGSTLTINPTDNLSNANTYTVEFPAGSVTDLAGNDYAGSATYNFTTPTFQNGSSGNGDLIFSAWDNAAGVGYSFDLGVALNSLLGADNAGTGAAAAANTVLNSAYTNGSIEISLSGLNDFLSNPALSNVEWNVVAAETDGRGRLLTSQGDSSTSMAMNNSKVSTATNNYNSYLDALSSLDGQGVNPVLSETADNAAYAGGATWSNTSGVSGGPDNSNLLVNGSSAEMVLLAQSNTLGGQGAAAAYETQVTDANGTPMTAKVYQDANGEWKVLLTVVNDTVAPTVTDFTPDDDAIGVAVNANIEITFSEAVKLGTGNIVIKDVSGKVFATYDVATSDNVTLIGNKLVINPDSDLAKATGYTVTLETGAVQDLYGNNLAGNSSYNFNTEHFESIATEATNTFTFNEIGSITLSQGSEISAYDAVSGRLFVTTPSSGLQVLDISNPGEPVLIKTIDFTATPFNFANNVNSVAVKNGVIAVAVAAANNTDTGKVIFINAEGELINSVNVGSLPDMLTFTPDGTKILVANEGESSLATVNPQVNPAGSVSIIDISAGVANATVQNAGFTAFDGQEAALREMGVRIFHGNTVSVDVEPEYIAVSPDGTKAMITLQEANAVAILDIATATITDIVPLGLKSWEGLQFDGSDRDGAGSTTAIDLVTTAPVFGIYMPDAIAAYTANSNTYYITANEGDDRDDFLTNAEKARLGSLDLDDATFPDETTLKNNAELGRLNTPSPAKVGEDISGDTDGDGDIDVIQTYGGRSFSILDSTGKIIFDSGDHIARYIATTGLSTAGGSFDDTRSDDKGGEPEGVTIAVMGGRTLAFIGLERYHGVMVYDVTDPADVSFVTWLTSANDFNPEGLTFISADDSPTGSALLIVTNEGDGPTKLPTLNIYTYDNLAPTVVSFSPADESTTAAVDSNIVVTFSEAIMLGEGNIVLKSGDTVIATYNVATSTNLSVDGSVLTINPTSDLVGSTAYTVEFAAGTITDLSGNDYAVSPTYNFTTAADTVVPQVLEFAPADEAVEVDVDSNIVVTFTELITRGTGNIVIKSGETVIATYDAATSNNLTIEGNTLTINPTEALDYGVEYSVEFAAGTIKDTSNNSFAGTTTYNFTTENDFDAPLVATLSPTDNAEGVALGANIVVTFNEAVKFGSAGSIIIRDENDEIVEEFDVTTSTNISINGAVLTINPTNNLKPLTTYTVEFDTGAILDLQDNSFDGNIYEEVGAYDFTTLDNTVAGATTGNNKLTGTANDDLLDGLAGRDTLIGLAGNDTYKVDNAKDVVTEAANGGTDEVIATVSFTLGKNVENLTLVGDEDSKLKGTGNELANLITSMAGNNTLTGGLGNDTIIAGDGNDVITSGVASLKANQFDNDVVDAGNGNNKVTTGAGNDSITSGDGNDNIDGGIGNDTMSAGDGKDTLIGGTGDDSMNGGGGNDKINGGTGDDTLIGDTGNDLLVGGTGNDVFSFGDDSGFDIISDFSYKTKVVRGEVEVLEEDRLYITGHDFNDDGIFNGDDFKVSMAADDSGALVTFNDGGYVWLKGVDEDQLDELYWVREDDEGGVYLSLAPLPTV